MFYSPVTTLHLFTSLVTKLSTLHPPQTFKQCKQKSLQFLPMHCYDCHPQNYLRIPFSLYAIRKNKEELEEFGQKEKDFFAYSYGKNKFKQIAHITFHDEVSICHMRSLNYLASVNLFYSFHSKWMWKLCSTRTSCSSPYHLIGYNVQIPGSHRKSFCLLTLMSVFRYSTIKTLNSAICLSMIFFLCGGIAF